MKKIFRGGPTEEEAREFISNSAPCYRDERDVIDFISSGGDFYEEEVLIQDGYKRESTIDYKKIEVLKQKNHY